MGKRATTLPAVTLLLQSLSPDTDKVVKRLVAVNGEGNITTDIGTRAEQPGRVAAWAIDFNRLLADRSGIAVFTVS